MEALLLERAWRSEDNEQGSTFLYTPPDFEASDTSGVGVSENICFGSVKQFTPRICISKLTIV
jgi:hypothetical protein